VQYQVFSIIHSQKYEYDDVFSFASSLYLQDTDIFNKNYQFIGTDSPERKAAFSELFSNVDKNDEIWVLGTGVIAS